MLTNKMAVDFNMFDEFMKNIIMGNLNGITIITGKANGTRVMNTHIIE